MLFRSSALVSASAICLVATMPALAQDAAGGERADQDLKVAIDSQTSGDPEDIVVTAQVQGLQALGATTITAEDIAKQPPVNDLSDLLRRQPGLNLTGAGSAGTYGNNRQIDIRGMGPENTLILVDGKPAQSRNSVRMGRDGERNTRGDTNWVPAEEVERIEILRGPAAARYGAGAAGGVINIITKGPATEFRGNLSTYILKPESDLESMTYRGNASVAGPLADGLGFRVYGNWSKTTGDDPRINAAAADAPAGTVPPGGREGVENRDINGLVRWQVAPGHRLDLNAAYSRQGNEYQGEYRLPGGAVSPIVQDLIGEETNVMRRTTLSGSYDGLLPFGNFEALLQFEQTKNRRLNEGLAGGGEGTPTSTTNFSEATLRNWYGQASLDLPFETAIASHVLTLGTEFRHEYLNDAFAVSQGTTAPIPGLEPGSGGLRNPESDATTLAVFVEDNITLGIVTLTPGVRFDNHSTFGDNWSPSFSAAVEPFADFMIKGGIARAFAAPNLYQSNPNYLYYTAGFGCPFAFPNLGGGCYVQGNADLEAETSINKEIGIAYSPAGWNVTATYFRNDYDNKIIANNVPIGTAPLNGRLAQIFQWYNSGKAVVEGLEGNLLVPVLDGLSINTNVTYMIQNENRETGRLLSVVPDYTVNTTLDWEITDQFTFVGTFTRYGEQQPNGVLYSGGAPTQEQQRPRDPYNLVNINLLFRANEYFRISAGVNNLFDEALFRESANNGSGANNYNEPGRAFFLTTNFTF
ncbi:outer membrane receptor protein [Croceibacterium mercuriale]|uniref:Outer membrane receptor protein n=1 Tax=Croceibacterium mercuriale TaxID=1572751 RepID=A0A0B2C051_9SPHN|nr:FepA family TonB-dependent siderophore receptor [Croceibacterium mercuriale]KHL25341.1 outer membrane receptor protein [Croceibacterium mercuriale]